MYQEDYQTRDIYLAATLITLRFPMIGINFQIEGTKPHPIGYFVFEQSEALNAAITEFWQGNIVIEPRTFITNMKGLKTQINNLSAPSY